MTPVEDVLAKIRHRYLIIGSGALRLHGIDWEEGDLDIWLDPNLSDEDWQASVDDAAGSLKRPWKRGEPDGSFMRDRVTFCIKTIHRPHCCATLVRSIYEHYGEERPLIYVLDDGKPEMRFSQTCPDEAAMVDRLIETEYDIGLSAGRNRLVEAAQTRMVIFSDDDHVVSPQTRLNDLVRKFISSRLDLLATLSKQPHRPHPDGTPRLLNSSGGVLHIPRGEYRRIGDIAECAFVCNCFVAHRDILQAIRWDEDLKVDEHWDFFWRAKVAGVKVGVAMDHIFPHLHVDPPAYKRHRPMFLRAALLKHGLRKVLWK